MTNDITIWKSIVVNVTLAIALTLKLAAYAQSMTFLDYFWGVGLYSFFAANLNTPKDS